MHDHETAAHGQPHLLAMRAWSATLAAHYLRPYIGESVAWLLCWHASWQRVTGAEEHIAAVHAAADGLIGAGSTLIELTRRMQIAQHTAGLAQLTDEQRAKAIGAQQRMRLLSGMLDSGADIVALRKLLGLSQDELAETAGVGLERMRAWEDGRLRPEGPARALLCLLARHPWLLQGRTEI